MRKISGRDAEIIEQREQRTKLALAMPSRENDSTESQIPMEIRLIVPMAGWIERHPRLSNWLIVIGLVAMAWGVFTYDFTIPAYREP